MERPLYGGSYGAPAAAAASSSARCRALSSKAWSAAERPPLSTMEVSAPYLRRRGVWMALRDEAEHNGEQLTPDSFRHRYAKGMHAANLPLANIAEAMGHTIEVHLKSYARFKPNAKAELIAALNVSWHQVMESK